MTEAEAGLGRASRLQRGLLEVVLGTSGLCLSAQIAIPLPFTPVPVTGQTFGVSLMSLFLGRRKASVSMVAYLLLGAIGLPVFAQGSSGLYLGPTLGYLLGMLGSAWIIGGLADSGFSDSFWSAWLSCLVGSVFIYGLGLTGLLFFVPKSKILEAGLIPFIPGDLIKTTLAASIASTYRRSRVLCQPPVFGG
ncbi:MAG: biotin transporter BioY [Bdellovibrionota bacterium]